MTSEYEFVERYAPDIAEQKYRANLREKGPDLKIGHDYALVKRIEDLIVNHGYSPGSALAELRNNGETYATEICEKNLYNYIYRGDIFLTLTPEHLHDKGRYHHVNKDGKKAARPHKPPQPNRTVAVRLVFMRKTSKQTKTAHPLCSQRRFLPYFPI